MGGHVTALQGFYYTSHDAISTNRIHAFSS